MITKNIKQKLFQLALDVASALMVLIALYAIAAMITGW